LVPGFYTWFVRYQADLFKWHLIAEVTTQARLWFQMSFYVFSFVSMSFYVFSFVSMSFYVFSFVSMSFYVFSFVSMSFYVFSFVSMSFYVGLFGSWVLYLVCPLPSRFIQMTFNCWSHNPSSSLDQFQQQQNWKHQ
jgi:hypothetical protein